MTLIRATIWQTYTEYGIVAQNVLHFDNPGDSFSLSFIGEEIRTNWVPNLRPFQSGILRYDFVNLRDLSNPLVASLNHPLLNVLGASGNNTVHPCTGLLFQFRTGIIGGAGRGRYYLAGTQSGYQLRVIPTTAAFTQWTTINQPAITARFLAGGNGPIKLVIAPKLNPSTSNMIPVSQMILSSVCAIQRRRNLGVGI